MIVVLADDRDSASARLAQNWARHGAVLMTAADLSRPGWRCNLGAPSSSRCCIGGTIRQAAEIRGVLVRCYNVAASQLTAFPAPDRDYAAAEMNAFLVYWLGAIGRPVLNRPTPRCLGGPGWYPEHWTHCAASIGLRVEPLTRSVAPGASGPGGSGHVTPWVETGAASTSLTIVGDRCFGEAHPALIDASYRLARASGVELVRFAFDGSGAGASFRYADLCPPLDDAEIEAAVLDYFDGRG